MNHTAITLAILSVFFILVEALAVAGRCYHRIISNKYAAKDLVGPHVSYNRRGYAADFSERE